jgi:hypothetical protein
MTQVENWLALVLTEEIAKKHVQNFCYQVTSGANSILVQRATITVVDADPF